MASNRPQWSASYMKSVGTGATKYADDSKVEKKEQPEGPDKLRQSDAWANHFLDDWKYRHEAYAKITYRYIWSLVVLAVLPLIPFPAQISPEFLQHVRQGTKYTTVYWSFVSLVFICTSWHLWREYHYLEEIRGKLQEARGISAPSEKDQAKKHWIVLLITAIYLGGFTAFFYFCIKIPMA